MSDNKDDEVEIIHRVNRLKKKVSSGGQVVKGDGYIEPGAIRRAQSVINDSQEKYLSEVESIFADLMAIWALAKKGDDSAVQGIEIYTNRIKDMASTYGYELMQYFSESLRDFSSKMDVTDKNHIVIGQAHIDVMMITVHEKIKEDDAPKAEELKAVLNQAIGKYSNS